MRRRVIGLAGLADKANLLDGVYQLRISGARLRAHRRRPTLDIKFVILAPDDFRGVEVQSSLHLVREQLWKLHWLLRDFGYDPDLLALEEIDERQMIGLIGAAKLSSRVANGCCLCLLEAFAPSNLTGECLGRQGELS